MNDLVIMPMVPGPDVWSIEHHSGPVVAGALVSGRLAIVLIVRTPHGICSEVSGVPSDVMTVLVI
jgi:hypothetical protein